MEEINFIRPEEVYNRNTGESKVRYRSYDGSNRFIPVVDGENGVPRTLVVTTHAELKAMRDAGKLTPGALYRITDYQCTTTQENTRSAGHQFDIVLLALSENKLAEEGWAMMNESNIYDVTFSDGVTKKCWIYPNRDDDGYDLAVVGEELTKGYGALVIGDSFDDADLILNQEAKSAMCSQSSSGLGSTENISYNYFQNSNLSAWKVWYSLDNDKSRFAWADPENGKGVIYRMIDEWGNDCPYDFKNIQFKRWGITALTTGSEDMKVALIYDADDNPFCFGAKDVYNGDAISGATFSTEISEFYFTFNAVDEGVNKDYSLGDWGVDDENGKAGAYLNIISPFYRDVNGEIGSAPIVLNNVVFINAFDGDYWHNCSLNKFGGNCQTLTFGGSCWQNTFGNSCSSNTFGNNIFGNTFGSYFQSNTFGNSCSGNTFGNSCSGNTFGNNFFGNTFGNNCGKNTFGNNAEKCSVGDGVQNITVSKDFIRYVIIENGNQKITITSNKTTSSSAYLQNFLIALGVNNSNTAKTISHNSVNDAFRTVYQNENSTSVNV